MSEEKTEWLGETVSLTFKDKDQDKVILKIVVACSDEDRAKIEAGGTGLLVHYVIGRVAHELKKLAPQATEAMSIGYKAKPDIDPVTGE